MSQQPPFNDPFVPPPPPQPALGNPLYPPDLLAAKAKLAASEARDALILSIVGLICFGFIFGFLAFRKSNAALETMRTYDVAQERRWMAVTARILGIVDIIGWVIALVARIYLVTR